MSETTPTPKLKKKDKITGKVIKTSLAGAVIDIGLEKPAVIPISQLRKEPVRRVEDVLKEGDEVEAWVRRSGEAGERIELTLIEPLALEWRDIKKGQTLSGKISKLEKFGAFVDLGAERPGLIHISEMSHDYIRTPEDAVKVGEEVEVQVLGVDRKKRQIKLSMKALQPQAKEVMAEEAAKQEPAPTAMEVAIRKAMDNEGEAAPMATKQAKGKKSSQDMEALLTRTLENRAK
ncbi:MAG: S1 RNA-binding domain-containing protein [Chloroflexi bacterium]|nr:S1 RNA-binding domain-containing protein [Chloroflexota bacterium]MQC26644.1 S1 RNA-binding domain-containing protein [Chloroflexota bacterium]